MYRLVLLNNEEIENKAIKRVVEKNFNNVRVVGESNNDYEALNLIEAKAPDIVFVGEISPGEPDIHLLKKIKNIDPSVKIIIASTYYHYEIVHQALKIGIMGLLLKPYREDDLVDSFNKVINSLEEESNFTNILMSLQSKLLYSSALAKKHFFYELIQGKYLLNDGEIVEAVKNLGVRIFPGIVAIAKIINSEKIFDIEEEILLKGFFDNITSEWHLIYLNKGKNVLIIFNDGKEDGNNFYRACKNALKEMVAYFELEKDERVVVTVGSYATLPNDYVSSYLEAEITLARLLLNGTAKTDKVIGYSDIMFDIGEEKADELKKNIIGALNSQTGDSQNYNLKDFLLNDSNTISNDARLAFIHQEGFFNDSWISNVANCDNSGSSSVMRMALSYICSNIRENINLKEVSSYVGVSPCYLSRIFKKEVGVSFKKYVKYMKVDKAKKLLLKTNYSVNEIAEIVGYDDVSYFCKVFKDIVGKTPNAFRKPKSIDQ